MFVPDAEEKTHDMQLFNRDIRCQIWGSSVSASASRQYVASRIYNFKCHEPASTWLLQFETMT